MRAKQAFLSGFKAGMHKASQNQGQENEGMEDGILEPDNFSMEDILDLPFFEKQDGTLNSKVKDDFSLSNEQTIPESFAPHKNTV